MSERGDVPRPSDLTEQALLNCADEPIAIPGAIQPHGPVRARGHHVQLHVGGRGRAGDAHQLAGAGGVEERGGRQVDDQAARPGVDDAVDGLAELWRRHLVQLTPYGEPRAPGDRRPFHFEQHGSAPSSRRSAS